MEYLQHLFDNSQWPLFSAFLLGLMTAISPCPMATNITAIAYVSKDIENRRKVFVNGLIYTLGRAISYSLLGIILFLGASQFEISGFFQKWGEKVLGPILIVIGIFFLDILKIQLPGLSKLNGNMEKTGRRSIWGVLLMGIVFALAFCPYSGVLYFGILIPMTIVSAKGLYLPIIFAIGTGLPVVIFAWIIAFAVGEVGGIYNRIKIFEKWFRKVVAAIFIGIGIYYVVITIF